MDDLLKALGQLKQEILLMQLEIQGLQAEKNITLHDGWQIITGAKKD